MIALLVSTGAYLLFAMTMATPYVPLVLIGLSHAVMTCCVWPIVAYAVPLEYIGTAYVRYVLLLVGGIGNTNTYLNDMVYLSISVYAPITTVYISVVYQYFHLSIYLSIYQSSTLFIYIVLLLIFIS